MGIYFFKDRKRACRLATRVRRYFLDMPNATLEQAAKHFGKSTTWVRNYKNLAERIDRGLARKVIKRWNQ